MTVVTQPEMTGFETEQVKPAVSQNRFFPGGQRSELLDQIVHLTRYGTLTVNVSGDAGTGKSHLLRAVKASLPGNAIDIQASLLMSAPELLTQLLHQLMASRFHHDLPEIPATTDEQALLSLIGSYFLRLSDSGNSIVILIDDAHEISEEALQVLLNLLQDKQYKDIVQCVLFSEPYIEKQLAKPGVKNAGGEQIFTLRMPLMDQAAIKDYLHFLEAVKPETERIMYSESDVRMIHELSEGKLGQVNAAIRSLLEKEPTTSVLRGGAFLSPVQMSVLAAAVITLGLILFLYQNEKSVEYSGTVDVAEDTITPKSLTLEGVGSEDVGGIVQNSSESDETVDKPVSSSLLEQLRKKQEELLEERKQSSIPGNQRQLTEEQVTSNADQGLALVKEVVSEKPKQTVSSDVESNAQKVEVDTLEKDAGSIHRNPSVTWISAQPGNRYTIQILGAHSKQNVSRYINGFKGDKKQLHIYEGVLRDQPWFVLIYGSYENRDAAKAAGVKLGLKDLWIRNFSAIQKEMVR